MKVRLNRDTGSEVVEAVLIQNESGKYSVMFNNVVLEGIKSLAHAKVEAEVLMNDWLIKLDNTKKVA